MIRNIITYLREKGGPATAVELARAVLKIQEPDPHVAERLIRSVAADSATVYETNPGVWNVVPSDADPAKESDEQQVVLCKIFPARTVSFAHWRALVLIEFNHDSIANPVWLLHPDSVDPTASITEAVQKAVHFIGDRTLVFDGFGNQISMFRRAVLMATGFELENPVIALRRFVRHLLPDADLPDVAHLSLALGVDVLEHASPEVQVENFIEQFQSFRQLLKARDVVSLEELAAMYRDESSGFDFSATAFDREYIDSLPTSPGVYVMKGKKDRVIYVGKARNLSQRLGTYFATTSEVDDKLKTIREQLYDVDILPVGSELEALLLEQQLISRYNPPVNRQVQVHARTAVRKVRFPRILVLPAADEDKVKLYLVNPQKGLKTVETDKRNPDMKKIKSAVRDLFFGEQARGQEMPAELEIAMSWLAANDEKINSIDMRTIATVEEAVRIVRDHIKSMQTGYDRVIHY